MQRRRTAGRAMDLLLGKPSEVAYTRNKSTRPPLQGAAHYGYLDGRHHQGAAQTLPDVAEIVDNKGFCRFIYRAPLQRLHFSDFFSGYFEG
jgi:hypothetical protein